VSAVKAGVVKPSPLATVASKLPPVGASYHFNTAPAESELAVKLAVSPEQTSIPKEAESISGISGVIAIS